ncbi:MAG: hypothetical protein ACK5BR_07715 [Bacteroidota bacterium]|jgi:hypothetical protein|nr:hypothetical protein [Algoriphagus sp.]
MLPSIPQETFSLVAKELQLSDSQAEFTEEEALVELSKAVGQLLDRHLEKLLQICYRVDLPEQQLKQILHESAPEQLAKDLAKALWERQKQKVLLRRRYSSQ